MAAVPSAPLLAPGVVSALPPAVAPVAAAAGAALAGLPEADLAVIVTTGPPGIDRVAQADLAGLGRPHLRRQWPTPGATLDDVAAVTGLPLRSAPQLGTDAACLALHTAGRWPVTAVSLAAGSRPAALAATGRALVDWADAGPASVVLIAASDGAAGLTPRAPRAFVEGTAAWQQRFVAGVQGGAVDDLAGLGPDAALRVGARGWAPMVLLLAAAAHAGVRVTLRTSSAPRGVGYLVADTA